MKGFLPAGARGCWVASRGWCFGGGLFGGGLFGGGLFGGGLFGGGLFGGGLAVLAFP